MPAAPISLESRGPDAQCTPPMTPTMPAQCPVLTTCDARDAPVSSSGHHAHHPRCPRLIQQARCPVPTTRDANNAPTSSKGCDAQRLLPVTPTTPPSHLAGAMPSAHHLRPTPPSHPAGAAPSAHHPSATPTCHRFSAGAMPSACHPSPTPLSHPMGTMPSAHLQQVRRP